jgi:hypothetical protein
MTDQYKPFQRRINKYAEAEDSPKRHKDHKENQMTLKQAY